MSLTLEKQYDDGTILVIEKNYFKKHYELFNIKYLLKPWPSLIIFIIKTAYDII